MRMDLLKCVDVLAVVFVALAWSHQVRAQDCSKAVPIMLSPNDDIGKAQLRATQKCEAERMRKGDAHRKSVQLLCGETADMQMQRDKLSPATRDTRYAACLRGHGYAQ